MNIYIFGHSIRSLSSDEDWTKSRRSVFLLNEKVPIPKSVDANVWEEVFAKTVEHSNGKVRLPCWNDREEMLKASQYSPTSKEEVELTIALFASDGAYLPEKITINNKLPADQIAGFFLGYDIADDGLISALSNCGYSNDEIILARKAYAPFLNKHGLIKDIKTAEKFRSYSETRVPDHAPFFVFGLYVDKEI
jgi:hypothetical protein